MGKRYYLKTKPGAWERASKASRDNLMRLFEKTAKGNEAKLQELIQKHIKELEE